MKPPDAPSLADSFRALVQGSGQFLKTAVLNRVRTVYVEVTLRCNARCEFCDYWKRPRQRELARYGEVVARFRPLSVSLTGGEPLLRQDLEDIVADIKAAHPALVSVLTNGSLLTLERAASLRQAGVNILSISMNYLSEAQDRERHIPGLFDHLSELIPALPGLGFSRVNVNTVVLSDNLAEIPRIAEACMRWKVGLSLSAYSPLKANNGKYSVTPDQLQELAAVLKDVRRRRSRGLRLENSNYYLDGVLTFNRTGEMPHCSAGRRFFHVTPDGGVKPCPDLPAKAPFQEYDPRAAQAVNCARCWYACRGEVEAPISPTRAAYFSRLWCHGVGGDLGARRGQAGAPSAVARDRRTPERDTPSQARNDQHAAPLAQENAACASEAEDSLSVVATRSALRLAAAGRKGHP